MKVYVVSCSCHFYDGSGVYSVCGVFHTEDEAMKWIANDMDDTIAEYEAEEENISKVSTSLYIGEDAFDYFITPFDI